MILLLTLLINKANADQNNLDKNLKQGWFWETSPNVEICPDSEISTSEVFKTIDYWSSRGLSIDIGSVVEVDHCDLEKRNVIQIMGDRNLKPTEHGRTNIKWYYYGRTKQESTLYIKASRIQIHNDTLSNEAIVLHEFGHALGLDHTNDDIMPAYH